MGDSIRQNHFLPDCGGRFVVLLLAQRHPMSVLILQWRLEHPVRACLMREKAGSHYNAIVFARFLACESARIRMRAVSVGDIEAIAGTESGTVV